MADPSKTRLYRDQAAAIGEWAQVIANLGHEQVLELREAISNRKNLIGALERFDAHVERGQTIENLLVGGINFFDPHKTPFGVALRATGEALAPLEVPLTALSAPGVINSPFAPMRGTGATAALLARLPSVLRGTRVVTAAEEMVVAANLSAVSRPAVSKQYGTFADASTAGTFAADAPLMLPRSGVLGRLGLKSPVYTGGTIKIRTGLSAADEAEVLAHEGAHVQFAFQHPELKYLQSSRVPGVKGISAFIDELQAYRVGLGGGFHPGRAWQSLSGSERFSLITTPVVTGTGIYGLYDYFLGP
jgi:hypothetical protein